MISFAALVTLVLAVWGAFEVACDCRTDRRRGRRPTPATRVGDVIWFCILLCVAATALHSLAASWL